MRIKSLDALRGIAALFVVLHHCLLVWRVGAPAPAWIAWTPFNNPILGRPNVILFFVLSGYVLSLPFLAETLPRYGAFVTKRLCRIYLPFAAAILLSAALYAALAPQPIAALGPWFNQESWNAPLSADLLVRHLAMRGLVGDIGLDNVMWSLVYELRISLVFPLLILFVRTGPWRALAMSLAAYGVLDYACAHYGLRPPFYGATMVQSAVITAYFAVFFVLGIVLAMEADAIGAMLSRARPWVAALLWPVGIMALSERSDISSGIGAAILIVLAVHDARSGRWLSHPALEWLGRVSYSLYLVHILVLLSVLHLFDGLAPLWLLLLAVPPLALAAAALAHRAIELPSIALGRRLVRRSRFGVAPAE